MAPTTHAPAASDRAPFGAVVVFVVTGLGFLLAQAIESGNRPYTMEFTQTGDRVFVTVTFGFAVLGLYVLTFRPGNRSGRLLLTASLMISTSLVMHAVAVRLLLVDDPPHRVGLVAAWVYLWLMPAALALLVLIPATWPSGHVESARLRPFARVAAGAAVALVVAQAFAPDSMEGVVAPWHVDNPLGVGALAAVVGPVTTVSVLILLAYLVVSLVDLAVRSVRSSRAGLSMIGGIGVLAVLALVAVAARPLLGDGSWLAVVLFLALAGIGATSALAARAERRRAAAEDARTRLVAEREDERRKLRADLHDGLGPLMAALGLELDAEDDPASRARAKALLDDAIGEIRRISRNLRPATLDELGLAGALRRQAAALTEAGGPAIDVVTRPDQLPTLSASVEVAAFRIAGEAMTNAARHSGATHCEVRLDASTDDGAFHVEVDDDGGGLDRGHPVGLGLQTMHDRADELGGRVEVGPGPQGGTRVVAVLPVTG